MLNFDFTSVIMLARNMHVVTERLCMMDNSHACFV